MQKKLLISVAVILVLTVGLAYFFARPESASDSISESDYMGGCAVERYINGDCMFDSVKRVHANFYPLVTEDDGVWKKLESYCKEDLMKTAEQELEKLKKGQYKGQQEQVARVQSFIDILSKR